MGVSGWFVRSVAIGGLLAVSGCGGGDGGGGEKSETAIAEFSLQASPDFHGNSVKLSGKRLHDADKKYPCANEVPEACYAFDQSGKLVEWNSRTNKYEKVKFDDLCPSANAPESDWQFDFVIFTDDKCGRNGGESINGPYDENNFTCYDSKDLFDQQYPNQSIEELKRGKNENEIICVTKNAAKTFDFDVCTDETHKYEYDSSYDDKKVFDCGCEFDNYAQKCVCDQGIDHLPSNCETDPWDYCNIVCEPPTHSYP